MTTNMMQDGATWLGQQLSNHTGRAVTYRQGNTTITGKTPTAVVAEHEVIERDGFATKIKTMDWSWQASDLGSTTPRPGDLIIETLSGTKHTYQVVPLGDGDCCEPLDSAGILLLIHTKEIGVE